MTWRHHLDRALLIQSVTSPAAKTPPQRVWLILTPAMSAVVNHPPHVTLQIQQIEQVAVLQLSALNPAHQWAGGPTRWRRRRGAAARCPWAPGSRSR